MDALFVQDQRRLGEVRARIPNQVGGLIGLFDGTRKVADCVQESPFGPFDTIRLVLRLVQTGALRNVTPLSAVTGAIAPITPNAAFPIGANTVEVAGKEITMIDQMSFCTIVNQAGLPAVAVPITRSSEGLPIGVQVIGRRDREMEVLAIARKLEQEFGGWMEPKQAGLQQVL